MDKLVLFFLLLFTLKLNLMEMNWFIISVLIFCAIILIFLLIKLNQKDEKKLKKKLNYTKKGEETELNDERDM
jgi:preprotein translocase subunit YajC